VSAILEQSICDKSSFVRHWQILQRVIVLFKHFMLFSLEYELLMICHNFSNEKHDPGQNQHSIKDGEVRIG